MPDFINNSTENYTQKLHANFLSRRISWDRDGYLLIKHVLLLSWCRIVSGKQLVRQRPNFLVCPPANMTGFINGMWTEIKCVSSSPTFSIFSFFPYCLSVLTGITQTNSPAQVYNDFLKCSWWKESIDTSGKALDTEAALNFWSHLWLPLFFNMAYYFLLKLWNKDNG